MTTIEKLLGNKPRKPIAVGLDDSVFDALKLMAEHEIGAVLVLDGDALVGIFSERDYARKVALAGKASRETRIREVMTEKVCYVSRSHSVEECMALMTDKHIRHLPVLDENQKVTGIVSIGDLVKSIISEQEFLIQQLEAYIKG
jgi:CBS domain-containing protein